MHISQDEKRVIRLRSGFIEHLYSLTILWPCLLVLLSIFYNYTQGERNNYSFYALVLAIALNFRFFRFEYKEIANALDSIVPLRIRTGN